MPRALLIGCALLILHACTTLGPDYREPEVDWLAGWQPDLYGEANGQDRQGTADLRFWWQLFNDPVLNRLIDAARQENLSLRIAGLRVLESRALQGIADSGRFPQRQQLSGAVNSVSTRQGGGDAGSGNQSLVSYQAGFDLGWELDFWGRFRRGIESADAAFFASIANQHDLQVLIAAQVTSLYFSYRTTELRIAIARENAALQRRSYEITQQVFASGQESELDLQQARTQYLATLATIPDLQATLIQTRNALAALLGRPPADLDELPATSDPLPVVDALVIRDMPARLLMRRPDIRASAWQVAAQSAQIGIAETEHYPAITLFGSVGLSGDSLSSSPTIGSLIVGPGIRWNVFDYGRIDNNVRVQDARLQQLIEQYRETVLQAAREIDDAAVRVAKTGENKPLLHESVEAAQRSLALANKRYREGYADFQRVLDAQRAVFSQTERELVNQGAHLAAIVDLYKAMGGGWLQTPVQQLIPDSVRETMQRRSDWGGLLTAPLPDAARPPGSDTGDPQHD